MPDVLEVKNVYKKYGKKEVVTDMSFSVKSGEIMGFLGPNGAGKTTVIKMIMGLINITKGEIKVCSHDVKKDFEKAAENFGGIIEEPVVYSELSALDNLRIFSKLYGNVTEENIQEMIKKVKLKGREKELVKTYSLGMRQRIGIAQALIHRPKLLILDEPTNGLDPEGIIELRGILKEYAKEGVAVLVSSHLLSEMEMMCDRVCIIDKGKLIEIRDLKDINNNQIDLKSYIFDTSDNNKAVEIAKKYSTYAEIIDGKLEIKLSKEDLASLNKEIIDRGIRLYTVCEKTEKLEDIYLKATSKKVGDKKDE